MSEEDRSKELYSLCRYLDWEYPNRFEVVQEWLDNNKDDEDLLIKAANYKGKDNWTPLHYLVRKKPPSNLVERLLQLAPDTIKVQDNSHGALPLHYALWKNASSDVIKMLLQAYPRAVEVPDKDGWFPLHLALWKNASTDIVTMLLNKYPQALKVRICNIGKSFHTILLHLVSLNNSILTH